MKYANAGRVTAVLSFFIRANLFFLGAILPTCKERSSCYVKAIVKYGLSGTESPQEVMAAWALIRNKSEPSKKYGVWGDYSLGTSHPPFALFSALFRLLWQLVAAL